MQSIKQVAVFNASMAEGRMRSPLEAAADSPPSPKWPSPKKEHNTLLHIKHKFIYKKILIPHNTDFMKDIGTCHWDVQKVRINNDFHVLRISD